MDGVVVFLLVLGTLVLFGILALLSGVDSRIGSTDDRQPEGGLTV